MAKKGKYVFAKGGKRGKRVIPKTPEKRKGSLNEIAETMGYEHVSEVPDARMKELADKMVKKYGKKSAMGMARAQVVFRKYRKDGTEKKFEELDKEVRKVEEPSSHSAHFGPHEYVYVDELPKCDFCNEKARYDGRTKQGPWANMCSGHFVEEGTGLGLGRGQRLLLKGEFHGHLSDKEKEKVGELHDALTEAKSAVGNPIGYHDANKVAYDALKRAIKLTEELERGE